MAQTLTPHLEPPKFSEEQLATVPGLAIRAARLPHTFEAISRDRYLLALKESHSVADLRAFVELPFSEAIEREHKAGIHAYLDRTHHFLREERKGSKVSGDVLDATFTKLYDKWVRCHRPSDGIPYGLKELALHTRSSLRTVKRAVHLLERLTLTYVWVRSPADKLWEPPQPIIAHRITSRGRSRGRGESRYTFPGFMQREALAERWRAIQAERENASAELVSPNAVAPAPPEAIVASSEIDR